MRPTAGDVDYTDRATPYLRYRRPDPRIAARIAEALGDARTVLNVGAGPGSYEPPDREVTAVEPSAEMRARRPSTAPPAVDATAEALPFGDGSFDAAMSTFSIHQWRDLSAGLRELRRVTCGPVVILTGDPARLHQFWLNRYAPGLIATEARRYPPPRTVAAELGGRTTTAVVPIPLDCTDGFNEAYYGRPERLLDPAARLACSAWSFVAPAEQNQFVSTLSADLANGRWDDEWGALRSQPTYAGSLVLVVNTPSGRSRTC
jgi:SAM-dependent methyltransferase